MRKGSEGSGKRIHAHPPPEYISKEGPGDTLLTEKCTADGMPTSLRNSLLAVLFRPRPTVEDPGLHWAF